MRPNAAQGHPDAHWGTRELEACPLCRSTDHSELDACRDSLVAEINRYLPPEEAPLPAVENRRRRCIACGLVFLSPRLDDMSLARLYRLWYGYAYRRVVADAEHIAERRREFERHHLRRLRWAMPEPGRLLDVGCGTGLFLGLAVRDGWRVTGVELDAATAAVGRAQGLDIRVGSLRECLAVEERFDAITLFDYLEHSTTPGDDLDTVAARLAPGGALLVRVPNLAGWQSRWMGCGWLGVISNHLSYFTPAVLRVALERRGLRVVSSDARNYASELDILRQRWQWARARLARGHTKATDGVGSAPAGAPGRAHPLIRLAHSLFIEQLDHVGGWFGRGNNLMVVARRP